VAEYISKVKLPSGSTYFLKDEDARTAVETLETAVASSLVFKGVVSSAAGITGLKNYKTGWTYKASAAFTISNIGKLEAGDMIICISDYSSAYKASDWTVVQNNIDTMTGATTSAAGTRGLVPAPSKGEANRFLRSDGSWATTDIEWGSFSDLIS
jgi:hypothetical protein